LSGNVYSQEWSQKWTERRSLIVVKFEANNYVVSESNKDKNIKIDYVLDSQKNVISVQIIQNGNTATVSPKGESGSSDLIIICQELIKKGRPISLVEKAIQRNSLLSSPMIW
jgi:hypothetical protein